MSSIGGEPADKSLHRTPDASVTRLAYATRAPAAGAGELRCLAALLPSRKSDAH